LKALLGDQALLAVTPWSAYRDLRARMRDAGRRSWWWSAFGWAVFQLLGIGVFVSLTASGRLVAGHVLAGAFYVFGPVLQAIAVAASLRVASREEPFPRALSLYYAGQGPWILVLAVVAALPVLAPGLLSLPNIPRLITALFTLLGVGLLWGGIVTFAFFRAGLDLGRARAAAGTAVFYLVYVGSIVGYYLAMNQIQPQLLGTG
jgi:hypothetical protein